MNSIKHKLITYQLICSHEHIYSKTGQRLQRLLKWEWMNITLYLLPAETKWSLESPCPYPPESLWRRVPQGTMCGQHILTMAEYTQTAERTQWDQRCAQAKKVMISPGRQALVRCDSFKSSWEGLSKGMAFHMCVSKDLVLSPCAQCYMSIRQFHTALHNSS